MSFFDRETTPLATTETDTFLYVKSDYKTVRIAIGEITDLESRKDYVIIHLTGDQDAVKTLMSLKSIEERLPTDRFLRIHRSFILSTDKITAISKSTVHIDNLDIAVCDQYRGAFTRFAARWS